MSIHEGHRQRLRQRFRQEGLDHFDERQVLELLLFYAVPRQDTAPMAQALLDAFGSLAQVLEAPREALEKVSGVGESASTLLTLTTAVGRYYLVNRSAQSVILNTTGKCGAYLLPYFYAKRHETVMLLCLDAKCKVLCCKEVTEGSVNSASISVRRVVETALGANASTVVLAHNHTSGLAIPSAEDVQTTRRIAKALSLVEITLADHIVVAEDDFVSLAQSGLFHPGVDFED